jgi:phage/plasmid-like protein (TIGR03299 family)
MIQRAGPDVYKANFTSVKDFPIYGVGQKFADTPMTAADAMKMAGLDFNVLRRPAMAQVKDPATGEDILVKSDKHFLMLRDDNFRALGAVGSKYQEVQNRDAFEFMDSLSENGEVRYLSVAELNHGAKICLFAEIPGLEFEPVKGDVVKGFAMLDLTHDGTGSVRVGPWSGRMACMNLCATLRKSVRDGAGVSIRHSGDIESKLAQASKVLRKVQDEINGFADHARHLASKQITKAYLEAFIDDILPMPKEGSRPGKRVKQREAMTELVQAGAGTKIKGVRGTRWGLLNAVTEYTNHERSSHNAGTHVNSLLYGSSNAMNQQAFRYLMDVN